MKPHEGHGDWCWPDPGVSDVARLCELAVEIMKRIHGHLDMFLWENSFGGIFLPCFSFRSRKSLFKQNIPV